MNLNNYKIKQASTLLIILSIVCGGSNPSVIQPQLPANQKIAVETLNFNKNLDRSMGVNPINRQVLQVVI